MLARSNVVLLIALATSAASAQVAPRELSLVPDGHMDTGKTGGSRDIVFATGPGGRSVAAPRGGWGNIIVYDSAGAQLPWTLPTGRSDNAEIMFPGRVGWISGTNTMWVSDFGYQQVVLIDDHGKVTKSIENPSWVHPSWAERRKYPVYGRMEALALYPDQTMLVNPSRERSFISTPGYDKTRSYYLRTTLSGAIQRTVVSLPNDRSKIDLRDKNRNGHTLVIPFAARTPVAVSGDGMRIAIVSPSVSAADSGMIRVTMLDDKGDTVFARKYPYIASRLPKDAVDQFLAGIRAVGDVSAEQLRDSASKLIPAFRSYLTGVLVGYDHSTWLILKPALDTAKTGRAIVIDARGDVVGMVTIPADHNPVAVSLDHMWAFEIGRMKTPTGIIRYAVGATSAPPARSAKAATSSTPSRPPR